MPFEVSADLSNQFPGDAEDIWMMLLFMWHYVTGCRVLREGCKKDEVSPYVGSRGSQQSWTGCSARLVTMLWIHCHDFPGVAVVALPGRRGAQPSQQCMCTQQTVLIFTYMHVPLLRKVA